MDGSWQQLHYFDLYQGEIHKAQSTGKVYGILWRYACLSLSTEATNRTLCVPMCAIKCQSFQLQVPTLSHYKMTTQIAL